MGLKLISVHRQSACRWHSHELGRLPVTSESQSASTISVTNAFGVKTNRIAHLSVGLAGAHGPDLMLKMTSCRGTGLTEPTGKIWPVSWTLPTHASVAHLSMIQKLWAYRNVTNMSSIDLHQLKIWHKHDSVIREQYVYWQPTQPAATKH